MADLQAQLQAALGSAYRIERELGGGGMSRVFVATEVALGRQVVVKVLPDQATGGSLERFQREIALAARLQHPNIVPVLTAGDMHGVPYYTMPLVAGESLRQRLAQHGELSVEESIGVLRQVADALSYAHEHGVVHRDIKPENILLTKKHALVVDFGVAKAIAGFASTHGRDGGAGAAPHSLTSLGVALGTPAYMSPEQATADPSTDHRADIYALGCVGYEMLTGYPLFPGRSGQAALVAHAAEAPEPILNRRASTPPALAELIMRCLEKRPGDRPQSAAEVERVLVTLATTPSGGTAPTTATRSAPVRTTAFRRLGLPVGGAIVLVAAVATFIAGREPAAPLDNNVIAVAPFRVSADPSLAYLREGMLDLLAANLTGEGGPRATDPRASLAAWRQAGGDEREITEEESRALARRLGAARVLLGSVVGSGSRIVITASVIGTADGASNDVRVEGSVDSLTHLVDRLTSEVLTLGSAAREIRGRLAGVPLTAVRAWLDGQAAYRRGRYHEASALFLAALRADSTFVPAITSGLVATNWASDGALFPPELLAAVLSAWQRRAELTPRDRIMLATFAPLVAGLLPPGAVSMRDGLRFLDDSAAMLASDNPDVLFMVADNQFHYWPLRKPLAEAHRDAEATFARILAIDSSYAAAYEHLVDIALVAGDTVRAREYANHYFALDSLADHADYIRWRLAAVQGTAAERDSIRGRFDGMSYANLYRIAGTGANLGLDARDVLAAANALDSRATDPGTRVSAQMLKQGILVQRGQIDRDITAAGGPPFVPPAVGDLIAWSLLAFEDEPAAEAAARVADRWLETPLGSDPSEPIGRYVVACALGAWYLSQGNLDGGEGVLGEVRRRAPDAARVGLAAVNDAGEPFCPALLEAWLSVLRGRPDARGFVQHVDSLLRTGGMEMGMPGAILALARLWETLGEPGAAVAVLRRLPFHPSAPAFLPLAVLAREEGRLAALTGDREGAIQAYRRYLAIRVDPVDRLKPEVESVRQELARLERESAGK